MLKKSTFTFAFILFIELILFLGVVYFFAADEATGMWQGIISVMLWWLMLIIGAIGVLIIFLQLNKETDDGTKFKYFIGILVMVMLISLPMAKLLTPLFVPLALERSIENREQRDAENEIIKMEHYEELQKIMREPKKVVDVQSGYVFLEGGYALDEVPFLTSNEKIVFEEYVENNIKGEYVQIVLSENFLEEYYPSMNSGVTWEFTRENKFGEIPGYIEYQGQIIDREFVKDYAVNVSSTN